MNLLLRSLALIHREFRNSLRAGTISLFLGIMSANAIAYAYHSFMARMMSPGDYGALVTLTSISYVLAVLARTLQAWIIKTVCAQPNAGSGHIGAVFSVAIRTVLPVGSMMLVGHWIARGWIAEFLRLEASVPVMVLGVYAFTSFLTPVPRGLLLGLGRLHLAGMIYILEAVIRLVGGIVLVTWGLGVNGALASYALGELVAFSVALAPVLLMMRGHHDERLSAGRLRVLDHYALMVLLTNTVLMIMANIDQIAVKHFFSEQVAGNYAVAFLLGRIIVMSTMALSWTIFPRAASLTLGDPRQTRLLVKGLLATGCIALSLMIGYLVAPALAIRFMGGSQYDIAHVYIGLVGIEMAVFAFVYIQVYFLMSLRQMHIVWPLLVALAAELLLLAQYHATVEQILWSLILVVSGLCCYVSLLSWYTLRLRSPVTPAVPMPASKKSLTAVEVSE